MKFKALNRDIRFRVGLFFGLIILFHCVISLPAWLEWGLAIPLIGLLGISHGAIDHIIVQHAQNKSVPVWRIILTYLMVIVVYGFIWILSPIIGLLFFLVLSAYHFGEAELHDLAIPFSGLLRPVLFFLWGMLILAALFHAHFTETVLILLNIAPQLVPSLSIGLFAQISVWSYVIIVFSLIVAGFRSRDNQLKKQVALRLVGLHVILVLFHTTSLILSFALFFGLWHALPVLKEEFSFLENKDSGLTVAKFIKLLIPFTVVSLVGIAAIATWIYFTGADQPWILASVIGISVLTLPHAMVMQTMYNNGETE